jgi:ketosteroid isomerase-like protein
MNPTLSKLLEAISARDADRMAACFTPDFRSEQPTHPNRAYAGRDTTVAIWGDLFREVPDLTTELLATVDHGSAVWAEWYWHGHHTDGSPFELRAVTIAQLTDDGLIASQRLYGELVEREGADILESERQIREPAR